MNLHDKHLEQALHHAPDRDLVPSDAVRQAVMNYAKTSLNASQNSLSKRLLNWITASRIPNWQVASAGSVFATLLIAVVFWGERPDDFGLKTSAPASVSTNYSDQVQEAQVDAQLSKDKTASMRVEEKPLAAPIATVPKKESFKQDVANATKLAKGNRSAQMAPETSGSITADAVLNNNESGQAKNAMTEAKKSEITIEMDGDSKATMMSVAPAPVPASIPTTIDETSKQSADQPRAKAGMALQGDDLAKEKKMEFRRLDARRQEPKAEDVGARKVLPLADKQLDANDKLAAVGASQPSEPSESLSVLIKQGGKELAQKDFQAGHLRWLTIEEHFNEFKNKNILDCREYVTQSPLTKDVQTGLNIETLHLCFPTSELLFRQVEAYNHEMRAKLLSRPRN